jgi:Kef-type K+ transport system membrane component KefB
MIAIEQTLLVLLLILFFGLLVPELFKKLRLPYITTILLLGAVLGPKGLDYIRSDTTIEFFGFLGSAFLMLMAGLEVKIEHLKGLQKQVFIMVLLNGGIPFLVGFTLIKLFGYSWLTSLLIGTVFVSSSVAVVASIVRSARLTQKPIGQTILSVVVIEDLLSLLILSLILQSVNPITAFPLPIYFGILISSIIVLKMFLPQITKYVFKKKFKKHDEYESQLRFVIIILMAVLLYFSGLGVHPIIASFVVGFLISDVIKSDLLIHKLHTLGYGLFVPVFFFIVGMQMDLTIFFQFDLRNIIMVSLILGLLVSKFVSGYASGRITKLSKHHASLFGVASTAQLTTTLATTYAAASVGILDSNLVTSIIILSVVTMLLSPLLFHFMASSRRKKV